MSAPNRRVVVTQRFFDAATIAWLEENGCEVIVADLPPGRADGDLSPSELESLLAGAAGWIVGHARVTRDLLTALPDLRVISRRGVGYERVDTVAVRDLGRVACIAVGGNDASVADHTIAMMLALGRRFRESQDRMLAGDWSILMGTDLFRKTVGIIGLGRIGRSLVQRLQGFEARILVLDRMADRDYADAHHLTCLTLPELLGQSDYVSLHAPLTPETRFLIDADALGRMKPTSFLINAARGGLVDDMALLEALRSGTIAGAGLDTFVSESDPGYRPTSDALLALPNVVATPHAAASSREGLDRTNRVAAMSVVDVLDGRTPPAACVIADGRVRTPA
ncbi:hydroxyacid dehydrogenase [Brevundimonas sp. LM2]|uniref:phosphoglycerate dehydrogenase n=1 Tax=Brevundimonas sp. LM2 TaxID=1938605 RepID=UPI000983C7A1|nr:phosphoglycerate dehydrogenase [Brevundimonas sp. LM2]AQR62495.1 hydroxyacid dehydrogenase [Brevundimonas sp. LM2]